MARRYALHDDQWERIQGLLPGRDDNETIKEIFTRIENLKSG